MSFSGEMKEEIAGLGELLEPPSFRMNIVSLENLLGQWLGLLVQTGFITAIALISISLSM